MAGSLWEADRMRVDGLFEEQAAERVAFMRAIDNAATRQLTAATRQRIAGYRRRARTLMARGGECAPLAPWIEARGLELQGTIEPTSAIAALHFALRVTGGTRPLGDHVLSHTVQPRLAIPGTGT